MIVEMKKVTLVVQDKDIPETLEALRGAGTVHVEYATPPLGEKIVQLNENEHKCDKVVSYLAQVKPQPKQVILNTDWQETVQKVIDGLQRIHQLRDETAKRRALISQWTEWGDFQPADIEQLKEKGIFLYLAELNRTDHEALGDEYVVEILSEDKQKVRCLIVTRDDSPPTFEPLMPESLSGLKKCQEAEEAEIVRLEQELKSESCHLKALKKVLQQIRDELKFEQVYAGRGTEDRLAYLTGYCPVDQHPHLIRLANRQSWAIRVEDPADDDDVPTLLRNPRWVKLIKPIFDLINIQPGYREIDISIPFLLFFAIFVGILIGDAGYGLFSLFFTLMFHLGVGRQARDKTGFLLLYVLGMSTVVWGMLTGTFFGQAWLPEDQVKPLVPWLADNTNVQVLCFLIGAVHLSIAHVWRGILRFPSLTFLSEVGWLSMIWAMFFVAQKLVLGLVMPTLTFILLIIGPVLIILFSKPKKNVFKRIGAGLGEFLMNVVNTFTDVVSYIRLFAVGLATVAVADAFNAMAAGVGFNDVVTGLFAIVILVLGHIFNLILGALAILVHGLRLNVLEFSGHLNMEWSGFPYQPFKKNVEI